MSNLVKRRTTAAASSKQEWKEDVLLSNNEQEKLIEKYRRDAKSQETSGRRLFGFVCYALCLVWVALCYCLLQPVPSIGLAPLRRLTALDSFFFSISIQGLSLIAVAAMLGYSGYKLRALEGPNSVGVFACLVSTTTYWTSAFLINGVLIAQWQGYFILSMAPTLLFALIFFIDWELATLVKEADGLEKYRYNYEKP